MRSKLVVAAFVGVGACAGTPSSGPASRTAVPDVRRDFLRLVIRPPVALEATEKSVKSDGLAEYRITYRSDADNVVPGMLVKRSGAHGRRPAVICLHGTGGNKTSELPMMRELAQRGLVAVSIDGRSHGERAVGDSAGLNAYQAAILAAYRGSGQHPFFYDTAWDVMRLVDYLLTRPDVDPERIGVYGVSKGGIEAYIGAAIDRRIKVAVPCIAMESFRYADDHAMWQPRIGTIQGAFDLAAKEAGVASPDGAFVHAFYARVAPEIDGEFDGPSMGPLIAPRALLLVNGERDPRTPAAGLKLCTDAISAAYHAAEADDRFSVLIEKGAGHQVTSEGHRAAVDWLVRWLGP